MNLNGAKRRLDALTPTRPRADLPTLAEWRAGYDAGQDTTTLDYPPERAERIRQTHRQIAETMSLFEERLAQIERIENKTGA